MPFLISDLRRYARTYCHRRHVVTRLYLFSILLRLLFALYAAAFAHCLYAALIARHARILVSTPSLFSGFATELFTPPRASAIARHYYLRFSLISI